jgi:hypothetical protein
VLNQTTATRMMIRAGRTCAAKTFAEIAQEKLRQTAQARIRQLRYAFDDKAEVNVLLFAQLGRACKKCGALFRRERATVPAFRLETKCLADEEFAGDLEEPPPGSGPGTSEMPDRRSMREA